MNQAPSSVLNLMNQVVAYTEGGVIIRYLKGREMKGLGGGGEAVRGHEDLALRVPELPEIIKVPSVHLFLRKTLALLF